MHLQRDLSKMVYLFTLQELCIIKGPPFEDISTRDLLRLSFSKHHLSTSATSSSLQGKTSFKCKTSLLPKSTRRFISK